MAAIQLDPTQVEAQAAQSISQSVNVYFEPNREFVVSLDGVSATRIVPGKDENGDPLIYIVPRYKAEDWQKSKGWGKIVDVRTTIRHAVDLPPDPPSTEHDGAEVVVSPQVNDPSDRVALQLAAAASVAQAQAKAEAENASPMPAQQGAAPGQKTIAPKPSSSKKKG